MRWFITGVSFDEPVFQKTGDQALVFSVGERWGLLGNCWEVRRRRRGTAVVVRLLEFLSRYAGQKGL
jgi:hypothetical protein